MTKILYYTIFVLKSTKFVKFRFNWVRRILSGNPGFRALRLVFHPGSAEGCPPPLPLPNGASPLTTEEEDPAAEVPTESGAELTLSRLWSLDVA